MLGGLRPYVWFISIYILKYNKYARRSTTSTPRMPESSALRRETLLSSSRGWMITGTQKFIYLFLAEGESSEGYYLCLVEIESLEGLLLFIS